MANQYRPVFAGQTKAGEKIVLYKRIGNETELHIQRPDGELWALSPGAEIETRFDLIDELFHIQIKSPEWSGKASGTKHDLLEEPAR